MSVSRAKQYLALRPLQLSVALALAMYACPERAAGQPANGDIIGQLAADCVTSALAAADTVRLVPDQRYEFIRTAVVGAIQNDGTIVVISPASPEAAPQQSSRTRPHAWLRYRIEKSEIRYTKAGDALAREIFVDTRVLATMSDHSVAVDSLCAGSFEDEIQPADVQDVEDSSQPLTIGRRPDKGWLRRIAEPAVVAAASAVAVYLFFNVRSDRNETP